VTIEIAAMIRRAVPLSEVFAYAEDLVGRRTRLALRGVMQPKDVVIGPYEIPPSKDGIRRAISTWELDDLYVSAGRIATVSVTIAHVVSDEEMGFLSPGMTEAQRRDRIEYEGYRAWINAGVHRTRASFGLAALLACSIATLCRARILDDEGQLRQGVDMVEPEVVAAMFAKHRDATCFEELADRLCADLNFAQNWPDWRAQLAAAEREPRSD
jgi:hypothetical protein